MAPLKVVWFSSTSCVEIRTMVWASICCYPLKSYLVWFAFGFSEFTIHKKGQQHVRGLAAAIVTILERFLSLPIQYFLSEPTHSKSALSTTYNFPMIPSFFGLDVLPFCFQPLLEKSYLTTTSTFTTSIRAGKSLLDVPVNSLFASLNYHLLSVLKNLFTEGSLLPELLHFNKLLPLLELLSLNSCSSDYVLIVHKQLVRALCELTSTACQDVEQLLILKDQVMNFSESLIPLRSYPSCYLSCKKNIT